MKKITNYLPLHFCVFLIIGICFQFYFKIWSESLYYLAFILVVLSLFLLFRKKVVTTIISFFVFFLLGVFVVYLSNPKNEDTFYKKHLINDVSVYLKVGKVLKPGNFYDKYEAEVFQVDSIKTSGKILVNIKNDSIANQLKVDDRIFIKTDFKELIPPLNPHQFDYKNYLAQKGIYEQVFLERQQFRTLPYQISTIYGVSASFRNTVQTSLRSYNFSNDEFGVISALLLGQRQDISKGLLDDYAKAGAIHILAVSGLHVGIILLILSWFLKPLERLRFGKTAKTIFIIIFLWCFAFIAGLSASVVRAVTMFTFLAVGLYFGKKRVVAYSLISSLFFLLIVKPMFLFDVGFQLSYLAVFGIIWVQPKLYQVWKPKNKVLDTIWQLFTVSIAAQVGILPLSLFYFHQFPVLFFVSNLVIIPFLGVVLFGGILVMLLAYLKWLPEAIARLYEGIIYLMNRFIHWVANQEDFLLANISFSFLMMLVSYLLIFTGVYFLVQKSVKPLIYFLISIVLFQSVIVFENHQKESKQQFIVFHKSRNSVFGIRNGSQFLVHHNLDSNQTNQSFLKNYEVGENVTSTLKEDFQNVYQFQEETILVVDSLGIYNINKLGNPIVVLQNSPKINLERLIKSINPKQIIADGSNYKSYVNRWEVTAKKEKTPFHYTGKNGAFILN